jgi:Kef-type K+ transport system membrane component KefB
MLAHWAEPWRLLLALAAVVAAARLGGVLARRLGQPAVVGEITGGIFLGPSLLGAVAPGVTSQLFPADVRPSLDALAQIGVVLFLFWVGLELEGAILRGRGRLVVAVGLASVLVPLVLGTATALLLPGSLDVPPGVSTVLFALFVGVALSVTALPVLARIVEDAGLSTHWLGQTALTCAALTDGAVWCLLIVVAALGRASGAGSASVRLALVVAFSLAALLVVRPLLSRLPPPRGAGPELVGLLVVAFAFASITQWLGVHRILGAVLAGVAAQRVCRRDLRAWTVLMRLNRALLLPIFFASVGLSIDLRAVLASDGLLTVGLLLLAVAVASKLGATSLAARAGGLGWRDAVGLGVLLNTKGLTELIVLKSGLDLGLIGRGAFSVLVVVALLTTAAAMPGLWLLGLVQPTPSARRRLLPRSLGVAKGDT